MERHPVERVAARCRDSCDRMSLTGRRFPPTRNSSATAQLTLKQSAAIHSLILWAAGEARVNGGAAAVATWKGRSPVGSSARSGSRLSRPAILFPGSASYQPTRASVRFRNGVTRCVDSPVYTNQPTRASVRFRAGVTRCVESPMYSYQPARASVRFRNGVTKCVEFRVFVQRTSHFQRPTVRPPLGPHQSVADRSQGFNSRNSSNCGSQPANGSNRRSELRPFSRDPLSAGTR